MSGTEVLDVARDALFVLIQVAGPLMGVGLVVGVSVALLQSLTQVQEMTLVFIPKIVAIFLSLLMFLPFMGQVLAEFMERMAARIIAG